MLCNNSKGYVFLIHLSDKVNRDEMDDSSANKINSLNLISMSLNILRNDRNHNTTAIANNNNENDNSIVKIIAIDILAMLVKSCSIKTLLFISNMLLK